LVFFDIALDQGGSGLGAKRDVLRHEFYSV